jgi:hypothetical protein
MRYDSFKFYVHHDLTPAKIIVQPHDALPPSHRAKQGTASNNTSIMDLT